MIAPNVSAGDQNTTVSLDLYSIRRLVGNRYRQLFPGFCRRSFRRLGGELVSISRTKTGYCAGWRTACICYPKRRALILPPTNGNATLHRLEC